MKGAREEPRVGQASMGERACRFWACFWRRGLFWACFSPATDDENCDTTERAPHEVSRCVCGGGCVTCVWGARAWASGA